MRSPRTTLTGIAAILTAGGAALTALSDGDPLTSPDWASLIAACIAGLGLIWARDNNVTSEQAGAR